MMVPQVEMNRQKIKDRLRKHRRLFNFVRWAVYSARGAYGRLHGALLTGKRWREYRAAYAIRKLHVGCGDLLLPGWFNTDAFPRGHDIAYVNATGRFPFGDGTFHYVFTEHMIEHVPVDVAINMLKECHRVLIPGGKIRISTPDLKKILALDRPELSGLEKDYLDHALTQVPHRVSDHPAYVINLIMRAWGHTFIYDHATLSDLLRHAGFQEITAHTPKVSDDPELRELEHHGATLPCEEFNLVESMVVEAIKPDGQNH